MANERAFLHSIATPLATVRFVLESAIEDLSSSSDCAPQLAEQLRDAMAAVDQAIDIVQKRREELIKAGVPGSQSSGGKP